jgi:hypothetical protein
LDISRYYYPFEGKKRVGVEKEGEIKKKRTENVAEYLYS